ncbi:hypothetical protein N7457_000978 [Penicillium paradoxum]|uniref:uncharacterized protein n=1 Tax=Penicillium paradoxum TaxID=176176 RepID=UPI0025482AC3|nr:uncharacterized protein N7457_000978 [Penicillium paradoxum]KAJ5794379.1 hypothetical protein N7457_000978 [Penicillium paradoxum]
MPYPYRHEPRQILSQGTDYERPILAPLGPRLPALVPERSADPRYMLSSDNVYMSQPVPQALPLPSYQPQASHDTRGYYNAYDERVNPSLGHARGYDSHRSRTYDVESQ